MPAWGVIPAIRVRDLAEALALCTRQLEYAGVSLDACEPQPRYASLESEAGDNAVESEAALPTFPSGSSTTGR